jgi:hypothetical protein
MAFDKLRAMIAFYMFILTVVLLFDGYVIEGIILGIFVYLFIWLVAVRSILIRGRGGEQYEWLWAPIVALKDGIKGRMLIRMLVLGVAFFVILVAYGAGYMSFIPGSAINLVARGIGILFGAGMLGIVLALCLGAIASLLVAYREFRRYTHLTSLTRRVGLAEVNNAADATGQSAGLDGWVAAPDASDLQHVYASLITDWGKYAALRHFRRSRIFASCSRQSVADVIVAIEKDIRKEQNKRRSSGLDDLLLGWIRSRLRNWVLSRGGS